MAEWEYEVVSHRNDVPVMTNLGQPHIEHPARRGDVFRATFPHAFPGVAEWLPYEGAVGATCDVTRRAEDGRVEKCGGAVLRVEPLVVSLNGSGFQSE